MRNGPPRFPRERRREGDYEQPAMPGMRQACRERSAQPALCANHPFGNAAAEQEPQADERRGVVEASAVPRMRRRYAGRDE